jgi:hypothetical protein
MNLPAFLGNPTRLLWIAMAISVVTLGLVLAYRLAPLLPGQTGNTADIRPIGQPEALASVLPPVLVAVRNPFDVGGTHWSQPVKGADNTAAGPIKGIVLLPGTQAVLTEGRTIKFGEDLEGGKLVAVEGEQLIIQTSEGRRRIDLPSARRPHLKDLNRP